MRLLLKERQTLQLEIRASMVEEVQEPGQEVALGGQGAPQQVHPLPEDLIPPHLEVARETQATKRPLRLMATGLQEVQGTLELGVTMGHQDWAKDILQVELPAKGLSGQEMGGVTPESLRMVSSLSSWANSSPQVKQKFSLLGIAKTTRPWRRTRI